MEVTINTEPVESVIRYPKSKYRNNERIGSEKFFIPLVYDFFEYDENRTKWIDEINIPLNCLTLDELIFSANLEYGKPSIYNCFTTIKYLETIDLDTCKPILLDWKNKIVDGRHRILKALVEGRTTIKAWRIKVGLDMDDQFLKYIRQ